MPGHFASHGTEDFVDEGYSRKNLQNEFENAKLRKTESKNKTINKKINVGIRVHVMCTVKTTATTIAAAKQDVQNIFESNGIDSLTISGVQFQKEFNEVYH